MCCTRSSWQALGTKTALHNSWSVLDVQPLPPRLITLSSRMNCPCHLVAQLPKRFKFLSAWPHSSSFFFPRFIWMCGRFQSPDLRSWSEPLTFGMQSLIPWRSQWLLGKFERECRGHLASVSKLVLNLFFVSCCFVLHYLSLKTLREASFEHSNKAICGVCVHALTRVCAGALLDSLWLAEWSAGFRKICVCLLSCSKSPGITDVHYCVQLYVGSGDLNLGRHSCRISPLLAQLLTASFYFSSIQFQVHFFFCFCFWKYCLKNQT